MESVPSVLFAEKREGTSFVKIKTHYAEAFSKKNALIREVNLRSILCVAAR